MGLFSSIVTGIGKAVGKLSSFFTGNSGKTVVDAVSSYGGKSYSGGSTHTYTTTNHNTTTTTNYNTTTTTYDPDRVKAAQIDKERAEIENERIELMRRAQLDIIEAQTKSRIAQEQARAAGFVRIAEAITAMQEKLDEIAEQRLAIIERGTLQAVREAENFYTELEAEIQCQQEKYMTEKLPALFEVLERYEEGSSAHTLYFETIQNDIALQINHTAHQLESARVRREKMIESIHETKREITSRAENITAGILDTLNKKLSEIDTGMIQLPGVKEVPALPA